MICINASITTSHNKRAYNRNHAYECNGAVIVQLQWKDKMEMALLTAMVEAVCKGLQEGFRKDAWKTAVSMVTNAL